MSKAGKGNLHPQVNDYMWSIFGGFEASLSLPTLIGSVTRSSPWPSSMLSMLNSTRLMGTKRTRIDYFLAAPEILR